MRDFVASRGNEQAFASLQEYCPLGSVVEIVINSVDGQPTSASEADVKVHAISPSGTRKECNVHRSDDAYVATFVPNEIGEWNVGIVCDGSHIRGSPYPCHIFDADTVRVYGLDVGQVGQELAFTVDASRAGRGELKTRVSRRGEELRCRVEERAGVYYVRFLPDGGAQYKIDVSFNDIDVKGSPFILDIADASAAYAASVCCEPLRTAAVGRLASFLINADGVKSKDITVIVTSPSKKEKHARILAIDPSTFSAEFKPIEAGEHHIDVFVHEERVPDSPFTCNVGDPDLVTVKKMPSAIDTRRLNTPHSFEIDATAAGSGNLEIIINGGRLACRVWETTPRHFQAQFTPIQPIRHVIEMKFNGEHVLNSPWQLPYRAIAIGGDDDDNVGHDNGAVSPSSRAIFPRAISPPAKLAPNEYYSELVGQGLRRAAVGETAAFEIKSESLKTGNVIIRLFDSEGRELNVKIIEKSHSLRCEYQIERVDEYRLEVYVNGRLIDSGPLFVAGYDSTKIRVEPFGEFLVGEPVKFHVDAVEAGKGQLEISVNQGRVPNNVQMQDAGRCLVTFIPQHSGTYVIDVTFNGQQVHGCPIKVDVQTKQIGKPVSAPVYSQTGNAGVGGMSPPPPGRGSSAMERGPSSSAYFSASSPYVDTTYSSMSYGAASPSPYANESRIAGGARSPPRSPPLVAHVQQRSGDAGSGIRLQQQQQRHAHQKQQQDSAEHLRSPRLVQSISGSQQQQQKYEQQQSDRTNVGYTVAQYNDELPSSEQRQQRYYEADERRKPSASAADSTQLEMTRSTEMTLMRSPPPPATAAPPPPSIENLQSPTSSNDVRDVLDSGKTYKRFETSDVDTPSGGEKPLRRFGDESFSAQTTARDVDNIEAQKQQRQQQQQYATIATTTNQGHYQQQNKSHEQQQHESYYRPPQQQYQREFDDDNSRRSTTYQHQQPQQHQHHQVDYQQQHQHEQSHQHHQHEHEDQHPQQQHQLASSRHIYDEIPAPMHKTNELPYAPLNASQRMVALKTDDERGSSSGERAEYTHVVEPHTSSIEAMTPSTRRKLLEHSVFKAADLKESKGREALSPEQMMGAQHHGADESMHEASSEPTSKHSSKPTTPRLSLKFGRDKSGGSGKDLATATKNFDFGKSKITSKNEVVRRGKDVEVKVESLKLSKDDQLKVIVMAPTRKIPQGEAAAPPEVAHKVKKSRNTYEISFRPVEVGTHKVLVFVNNQYPHPQTPFPIRVYDAGEILVGEIVRESCVNDAVEFTVDAGRAGFGNLEMAIKDSDQCIIPSHVSQLEVGTAKFLVTFNPTSLGVHTVNITFNKEVIKGSPFEVNVVEYLSGSAVYGGEGVDDASTLESKKKEKIKDKKDKKKGRSSSTKSVGSSSSKKDLLLHTQPQPQSQQQQQISERPTAATMTASAASPTTTTTTTTTTRQLVVSKIPSLSRVSRPAELIVTMPPHSDEQSNRQLEAHVYDSNKEPIPFEILDDTVNNAKCIQFVPLKVGDYEIELRWNGEEVNGSPFTCRAYDPTRIAVSAIPDGHVDRSVHFTVDAAAAGVGNLEVAVNDGKIPSMAHALGQHKYDISFVPHDPIDHYISVRFNNERVPGSPFLCRLTTFEPSSSRSRQTTTDAAKFIVDGPGLERVPINQRVEFYITVLERDMGGVTPEVNIVDLRGEAINAEVKRDPHDPTTFSVAYTPQCVGNHQVDIRFAGESVAGSPFTSKAFDANAARLILAENGAEVGRPCTFTIDAAKAGAGNMEIIVSVGKRNVPNFVTAESQAKFKVSFTPKELSDHVISVKFNGIPILGSPMRCPVSAPGSASAQPRSHQYQTQEIHRRDEHVTPAGVNIADDERTTSVANVVEKLRNDDDGVVAENGELRLAGNLAHAVVGRIKHFSVDAPASAARGADCNVIVTDSQRGPLPVRCFRQHDGSYAVEFTPEQIGAHKIEVTFADEPLPGSPFSCDVVDPTRVHIRGIDAPFTVHSAASIVVNCANAGAGDLTLELTDAQTGRAVKMSKLRTASGENTYTFLPTKLGALRLNAKLAGFALPGMPRTLLVEEPIEPSVYGAALDYACVVGQQASLIFDAKRANGGLKINVREEDYERAGVHGGGDGGSGGAKIRHSTDKRPDGTTEIAFRPTRVGFYLVAVDFNNRPVNGSPFRVIVVDPERVVLSSDDLRSDGALHLRTDQPTIVDVDASAAGPGNLRVEMRSVHSAKTYQADADTFTDDVNARVHDVGFGKWRIELATQRDVAPQLFYKLYAYWAELIVPSAYPLMIIARDDGGVALPPLPVNEQPKTPKPARTYKKIEQHEYTNGHGVEVHEGMPSSDVATRIHLEGDGLVSAVIKEPAEFFIDATEAFGRHGAKDVVTPQHFNAYLTGERADIPVRIKPSAHANVLQCQYTPLVPGRYELSVRYADEHVRGSPSTVDVRGHTSVAELIKVDAKTLKIGIIGEDVKAVIDARQAKAGQLSAQCVGPSELEYCELFDNRDGTYILRITPKQLGKHTLSVRYASEHVPGSPFTFTVANPPDPSQVRVYGPGIEHGILHSYKSNFVVETKGAGAGQLTVRVRGPKGAFNVEMQRDRQQDRTIHCKYEPREPGDYQVEVKWHGQHVPGSPFLVIIVDTEEELQRFLSGGAPSPSPTSPFTPPGWMSALPPIPPQQSGRTSGGGHQPPPPQAAYLIGAPPPPHIMPPAHLMSRGAPLPHPHMMPPPPHHLQHPIYGTRPLPRGHRY